MKDFISGFFENRGWLKIVQQNSDGDLVAGGSAITGVASVAWATFIDSGFDVATARYVHVSDKHSTRNATAAPGSLWRIDPTAATAYKRQLVSAPIYCANEAAAPAAASYPGLWIYDASLGPNGCDRISDGTGYLVKPGSVIHRDTVRGQSLIVPAATFTGAYTISDSGGLTKIKSAGAGAHGLSTAVAVTAGASYIHISAGTGWTTGLHLVTNVTVADEIIINTPYNAGFGNPTITKAGDGVDVVLETVTLPRLSANSRVNTRATLFYPSAATNKNFKLKLGATALFSPVLNAAGVSDSIEFTFVNRNSVSSQIGTAGYLTQTGLGTSSVAPSTSAIDTSTGTAQITLTYAPAAANEVCGVDVLEVEVS